MKEYLMVVLYSDCKSLSYANYLIKACSKREAFDKFTEEHYEKTVINIICLTD